MILFSVVQRISGCYVMFLFSFIIENILTPWRRILLEKLTVFS
jgi:succinate dehydrogenase/fumarate reductase cytochrome b subunit